MWSYPEPMHDAAAVDGLPRWAPRRHRQPEHALRRLTFDQPSRFVTTAGVAFVQDTEADAPDRAGRSPGQGRPSRLRGQRQSRSIVNGANRSTGPAPAAQSRASSSRETASSWRTSDHLCARSLDPSVDGALSRCTSTTAGISPASGTRFVSSKVVVTRLGSWFGRTQQEPLYQADADPSARSPSQVGGHLRFRQAAPHQGQAVDPGLDTATPADEAATPNQAVKNVPVDLARRRPRTADRSLLRYRRLRTAR